ncbi:MAG: hypothetical protein OEW42_03415 [Acidimicrobiia bacterium]|nr:hypothetical protein [Acidimicrobiia bacterium]
MVFPPTTASSRRDYRRDLAVRLDPATVERIYQAVWYLHPGVDMAAAVTRWTFEVAVTRVEHLPAPELTDAWLMTIADRELRRVRAARGHQASWLRPADTSARHDLAHRLADALQVVDDRQRLALVLRYRLRLSDTALAAALDQSVADAARSCRAAARRVAADATAPVSSLATTSPPIPPALAYEVAPLDRQDGRNRLDYAWRPNGFPTGTAYDNPRRRWLYAAAAALALLAAAMIGLGIRPTKDRPRLVDEPTPDVTSTVDSAEPGHAS